MNPATFAGLFLAGWIAQQPPVTTAPAQSTAPAPSQTAQEKPLATNLKVRVATSSYLDDGRVVSASTSDWPLALNKPVVAFATSGKTMCDSRAATSDQPTEYASGWRVEFTPVRESPGELVLQVNWSPLRNARLARVALGTAPLAKRSAVSSPGRTLTLHPGDRVVVDYISTTTPSTMDYWVFRPDNTATTATAPKDFKLRAYQAAAPKDGCNAVGMSLEIGLEPAKTDAVVEAELWLVRPNGDGTERSERQVLRLPIGQPASNYYFDEGRLVEPLPKTLNQTLAKVSGELAAASVGTDGKIHLNFKIARRYEPIPRGSESTAKVETSYRDLLAAPGEVLAFQLPTMEIPMMRITNVTGGPGTVTATTKVLPQLSVRLRTELVK